jgi:hypothetical protein
MRKKLEARWSRPKSKTCQKDRKRVQQNDNSRCCVLNRKLDREQEGDDAKRRGDGGGRKRGRLSGQKLVREVRALTGSLVWVA